MQKQEEYIIQGLNLLNLNLLFPGDIIFPKIASYVTSTYADEILSFLNFVYYNRSLIENEEDRNIVTLFNEYMKSLEKEEWMLNVSSDEKSTTKIELIKDFIDKIISEHSILSNYQNVIKNSFDSLNKESIDSVVELFYDAISDLVYDLDEGGDVDDEGF